MIKQSSSQLLRRSKSFSQEYPTTTCSCQHFPLYIWLSWSVVGLLLSEEMPKNLNMHVGLEVWLLHNWSHPLHPYLLYERLMQLFPWAPDAPLVHSMHPCWVHCRHQQLMQYCFTDASSSRQLMHPCAVPTINSRQLSRIVHPRQVRARFNRAGRVSGKSRSKGEVESRF